MIAATYDFQIRKGSDVSEPFLIQDDQGNPLDLTGWTILSQIRAGKSDDTELIAAFDVVIADPASGRVVLELSNAVSSAIAVKKGYYDILYIDTNNKRKYYCEGAITFLPYRTKVA